MSSNVRFTVSDLALLPEDGNRYEIIDGDLHVSTQPHWRHQLACGRLFRALDTWSEEDSAGLAVEAPGVVFAEDDAVAPEVVWVSRERIPLLPGSAWPVAGLRAASGS